MPTALITTPTSQCLTGNSFTFNSGSTISSGTITTQSWNFGDGTTGLGVSVSHSYLAAGVYQVTLVVTSDKGCTDSTTHTYTVFPQPVAIFANPAAQCLTGNNYNFSSTSSISSGTIASQTWKFGDGNTAIGVAATHTYASAGSFNATLIVVSDNGCTDSITKAIVVNPKPVAGFTAPAAQCLNGNSYNFTSTATVSTGSITTQTWKFGDGNTATGASVSHSYATAGTFNTTLIVVSDNGCIDSITKAITVNPKPVADFTVPAAQCLSGNNFNFTSTATVSAGSITTQTWKFGDGNTATGASVSHSYTTAGTFNTTLIVASDNGCIDSITKAITVNPKPVADFTVPAAQCLSGNNYNFTSTATVSAGSITTQTWKFGDGNTATGASVLHSYATAGTFNTTLIVVSNNGCIDSITKAITVNPKPVASFTAPVAQCLSGNSYGFTSTSTVSAGSITTQTWKFGDGNTATGASVTHTYTTDGIFTVTLIVSANTGCIDSVSQTITVYPKPKAIFTDPIAQCFFGNQFQFKSNSIINTGNISSYLWSFGDGSVASGTDVKHSYSTSGIFNVSLFINSDNGCKDSILQSVAVNPKPIASFSDPPPQCLNGNTFNILSTANIASGNIANQTWKYSDGNTSSGPLSNHSFLSAGTFSLTLIATSDNGCVDSVSHPITVFPQPIASFISPADQYLIGNNFTFNSNSLVSSGSISSQQWNFGDGSSATGISVAHSYAKAGDYQVSLSSTTDKGCIDNSIATVHVLTQSISASFIAPAAQCISFNNFNFTSNAIAIGNSIVQYNWSFGDGATGSGITTTHSYGSPGTYTVKLIVISSAGLKDSSEKSVTVYPQPSSDFIAPDEQYLAGNLFTFKSNASIVSGNIISTAWNFGDGNTSSTQNTTHSYTIAGLFNVTLFTTSDMGCKDSTVHQVIVNKQSSEALFVTPNAHCLTDNIFSFNSRAKVSSGSITKTVWDFGDGATGLGLNVTHSYTSAGSYNVTLIITTNTGLTDSVIHTIYIYPQPTASFIAPSEQLLKGNNFSFVSNSSISSGTVNTNNWQFGDGTNATGINTNHVYASSGTFNVMLNAISDYGCTDSVTHAVIVNRQSTAAIFVTPEAHCLSDNVFNFTSNAIVSAGTIISHEWNFGDGQTGSGANVTHTYTSAGTYAVKLITTTNTGLKDSVIHSIAVYPQPMASFIMPREEFLTGNNFQFNSSSTITSGFISSNAWKFGDSSSAIGNSVAHSYAKAGTFQVLLTSISDKGCADSIAQPAIVNTQSLTALFINPAAQCLSGNHFVFTSNATVSAGTIKSQDWDFGDGSTASGIKVEHSYSTAGNYFVKLITTTTNGLKDSIIHSITVNPQPTADILSRPLSQCLSSNNFSFTGKISPNNIPIKSFTWHTGEGNIITGYSINQSYDQPGNHLVKLITKSNAGCLDSAIKMVAVFQEPSVSITAANNLSICTGDSIILNSKIDPGSGQISKYQWLLNGKAIDGASTGKIITKQAGVYQLEVTNTNFCTKASDQSTLVVNPVPQGKVIASANSNLICEGDSTKLNAQGADSYQWYYNNKIILGATQAVLFAKWNGIYTAKLINNTGCKQMASDSAVVNTIKKPIADFSVNTFCIDNPVRLNNLSNQNGSTSVDWLWELGNGSKSNLFNPVTTYHEKGSYLVTLKVSPKNCPNLIGTVSKSITIQSPEPGERYPAVRAIINTTNRLQARNIGYKYAWYPSFGLDNSNIPNPNFVANKQTDYLVKIVNNAGCITYDTVLVTVFQNIDIQVPKAFTPNGDKHNDLLDVFTIGIKEFRFFRVYNRWGQLMYETRNPEMRWDGNYNGNKQPSETYVWIAEAVGIDNVLIQRRGQTVLLR